MGNIFRDYDIRGIYPDEINSLIAEKAGNAVARFFNAKKIIVGEDGRLSSSDLRNGLIRGIRKAGTDVVFIGRSTTPLFYYASTSSKADAGIMITASHNPPQYNGLKIVGPGGAPVGLDTSLADIREIFDKENFNIAKTEGRLTEQTDIVGEYVDFLIKTSDIKTGLPLKIVADAGNGVASLVLKPLFEKLKIDYVPLFFEIDGNFPGRGPDPAKQGATEMLRGKVLERKANMGVAFDGDADRMTVVDERGDIVEPQYVLSVLWRNEKRLFGYPKVVYDLRFSKSAREFFGKYGVRSKVGHNHIRKTARDVGAELAGETSGHFYFRKLDYTESVNLAFIKLLKVINKKPLSELVSGLKKYSYSGNINIEIQNKERADNILAELGEKYKDGKQDFLDGLTVEYWDNRPKGERWWFNIRSSNTEPLLRLAVEADTRRLMEEKQEEITNKIKTAA